jgi:hypothetical protein
MADNTRSRITAWPLDAWAKRLTSDHEEDPAGKAMPIWWADAQLWTHIPVGWKHIGYVEIGSSLSHDYDRGALLRHDDHHKLAMWTGKAMRAINQRKAEAAIAALGASK